jgi:hypothetical protein
MILLIRAILIVAATTFTCFAAFKMTAGTDNVVWLWLGLACFFLSFLFDERIAVLRVQSRRTTTTGV